MSTEMDDLIARLGKRGERFGHGFISYDAERDKCTSGSEQHFVPDPLYAEAADAIRKLTAERDEAVRRIAQQELAAIERAKEYLQLHAKLAEAMKVLAEAADAIRKLTAERDALRDEAVTAGVCFDKVKAERDAARRAAERTGQVAEALLSERDAARQALAETREALRKIADGDYEMPPATVYRDDGVHSKHDKCPHDRWMYEGCDCCCGDFARAALARLAVLEPPIGAQQAPLSEAEAHETRPAPDQSEEG